MTTGIQILAIVCITAFQSLQARDRTVESVEEELASVVNRFFPGKPVRRDPQEGRLVISMSTMPYQIHNIDKAGKAAVQAHEEIGPNADGFLIEITRQDGIYRGPSDYPQTVSRPYWKTYGTLVPIESNRNHIHVAFSYGSRVPEDFLSAVIKALEAGN